MNNYIMLCIILIALAAFVCIVLFLAEVIQRGIGPSCRCGRCRIPEHRDFLDLMGFRHTASACWPSRESVKENE